VIDLIFRIVLTHKVVRLLVCMFIWLLTFLLFLHACLFLLLLKFWFLWITFASIRMFVLIYTVAQSETVPILDNESSQCIE